MRCEVCGGTEFNENSGFYFCNDCGTQNKDDQVIEYDGYLGGPDNFANVTKLKKTGLSEKSADNQLTSWEEYNYILLGLVDELIDLGAKDELKITALQLWTTYLRVNEVAFFSRREPRIPKLGASFKMGDAEILYNLRREKRRAKRKAGSGVSTSDDGSTVFSRRSLKKSQGELARSEYEALLNERESNDSVSVLNRSVTASDDSSSCASSSSSRKNVRIEFSRLSRRFLKRKMPKKHLRKHETDALLDCHSFRRTNIPMNYYPYVVSRSMMYEILYLALNQIGDDLQVGDIIRYIREGHLTFTRVSKFFPDNVKNQKHQNNFNLSNSVAPSHEFLRFGAENQAHLLHVDVKQPDFYRLTKRYVEELALPEEVHKMVETLLMLCPPVMKLPSKRGYRKFPNFEGRAIAMVLFAVKLLFGLDDKRELELSESAREMNAKFDKLNSDRTRLFVWTDWMRFVEMRNVILAQCHYPTSSVEEPDSSDSAHLYLDFLHQQGLADIEASGNGAKCSEGLRNMETIFNQAISVHGINTDRSALTFQPSLTPKKSYLDRLLSDAVMSTNLNIPEFVRQDPSKLDIIPFLDPMELRRYLRKVGIRLKIETVIYSERLSFNPVFLKYFPRASKAYTNSIWFKDYQHDISMEDWQLENEHNDRDRHSKDSSIANAQNESCRNNLANVQERNRSMREKKVVEQKNRKQLSTSVNSSVDTSNQLFEEGDASMLDDSFPAAQKTKPRRDIDESIPLFEIPLSDEDNDYDDHQFTDIITLLVNNNEHWLCMGHQLEMTKPQFMNLCQQLPLNFQWMLRQCAHTVQSHERDVYQELQVFENQFAYVLKSFGVMSNTLLYQSAKKQEVLSTANGKLSKNLRNYW